MSWFGRKFGGWFGGWFGRTRDTVVSKALRRTMRVRPRNYVMRVSAEVIGVMPLKTGLMRMSSANREFRVSERHRVFHIAPDSHDMSVISANTGMNV